MDTFQIYLFGNLISKNHEQSESVHPLPTKLKPNHIMLNSFLKWKWETKEFFILIKFHPHSISRNYLQQQQNASKFHSRSRTMPRLNNASQITRNTTQLSTFQHQQPKTQLIDTHLPQINQPKKIPPKPPVRKQIRHDPEGIQQIHSVTAEFHEKKTFQLAVVQQTHKLALREIAKPPINFNHPQNQQQQHQKQHLLHQTQSSSTSMTTSTTASHFPNILIFGTQNFHLRHQQQQMAPNLQQQHQMSNNMTRMNFMRNQHQQQVHSGMIVANYSSAVDERSDPENHIYEMIDECEANGLQKKKAINTDEEMTRKHEHDGNDLFQNLLRTEMLNQLQLCNGNSMKGQNGFLSHLTHEKRMDIIQETALALASSAYVEK